METGLVGTGLMGGAMARRLLARAWRVTAWNREAEALPPLVARGAAAANSPAAVASAASVVLLCVLDTAAVEACVFGPRGLAAGFRPGSVLVDLSTIDPAATRGMAARLRRDTGTGWVDAPVSGGPAASEAGTLAIMAGGSDADLRAVAPVLAELGRTTRMGPVGAGQTAKLVNQALVGTGFVLMAEALAMAEAAGIDAARLPTCLAGGMADSRLLAEVFPAMQRRAFEPRMGHASQLGKDMRAVAEFAASLGLDLPVVRAVAERYAAFLAAGHGGRDSREIGRMYAP